MATDRGRRRRVLIHCQYVYGIGHLVRTMSLANVLQQTFDVTVLNGGEAVPTVVLPAGVELIQLPAIYKNVGDSDLRPVDPTISLAQCFADRRALIEQVVKASPPDVLLTEHFPFGLLFRDEALDLIEQVRGMNAWCRVVCSVRDVIETSRGGLRDRETRDILNRYYHLVLVHGDERIIPLSASFKEAGSIVPPVWYTGYVVRALPARRIGGGLPIVVAAIGGGRIGSELQDGLIACHDSLATAWPHRLRVFAGAFQRRDWFIWRSDTVTMEPFDYEVYTQALVDATVLICMGGYNSLLEGLSARLAVLAYGYHFGGQNHEQACRVTRFCEAGLLDTLDLQDLGSSERLSARILATLRRHGTRSDGPGLRLDLDGASKSRALLEELLRGATA